MCVPLHHIETVTRTLHRRRQPLLCACVQYQTNIRPSTARPDEWPAWFSFLVFWVLAGACQRHGVGGSQIV